MLHCLLASASRVTHIGDELVGPSAERFPIEWRDAVEQPLARAQRDGRAMQPQLIEQSRGDDQDGHDK
jgi:hypothetical protein